ncbi:GFA family protein [soil metagenome]
MAKDSDGSFEGGCLCGQVRYSVPEPPHAVAVCHCRDCQKQSGSAFSLIAMYPRDGVAISGTLSHIGVTSEGGNPVDRYFCGQCGSPIYSEVKSLRDAGLILIKAGTLDDPLRIAPGAHYWVSSKQDWVALPADAVCNLRQ